MLVEMAIADAYGAAFEFIQFPAPGLTNNGDAYHLNPETGLGGGRYTDDTQMALALAEHILRGAPETRVALADSFLNAYQRDKRPGYSRRFQRALDTAESGEHLLSLIEPTSDRSGAAMRAGPIGLYRDLSHAMELASLQASVTHDTAEGRASASAVAAMVHFLRYGLGNRKALGQFLDDKVPGFSWADDWTGPTSVRGVDCVRAAATIVRRATGLVDVLRRAVALGGDTDTVAAIAMFAASVCADLPNDLPASLYDGLEQGPFGRAYLEGVDRELSALA